MAEDDGLSGAPVVEIDLRSVLCRDRAHVACPFEGPGTPIDDNE